MSASRFCDIRASCIASNVIPHGKLHQGELDHDTEHSDLTSVQKWVDSLVIPSFVKCGDNTRDKNSYSTKDVDIHPEPNDADDLIEPALVSVKTGFKTTHSSSSPSTTCTSTTTFKTPTIDTRIDVPVNSSDADCVASVNPSLIHDAKDTMKIDESFKEHTVHKTNKGFLKKSLKELVKSSKPKVIVNGHTLSSGEIKRAEQWAGKLRPGNYWYDSKAGFWGVIGGPCLGIVPPFIEELNYPMSTDCSKGTTKVYVNGRELHFKDLEVLAERGLNKNPGGFYEITFDGVVIDGLLGEEIQRLGRLAPTVEKRGKGFGMFELSQ